MQRFIDKKSDGFLCHSEQGIDRHKKSAGNLFSLPIFVRTIIASQAGIAPAKSTSPKEVMNQFCNRFNEWTDNPLIKERLLSFVGWGNRNSLGKRRFGMLDYERDSVLIRELLMATSTGNSSF